MAYIFVKMLHHLKFEPELNVNFLNLVLNQWTDNVGFKQPLELGLVLN